VPSPHDESQGVYLEVFCKLKKIVNVTTTNFEHHPLPPFVNVMGRQRSEVTIMDLPPKNKEQSQIIKQLILFCDYL